MDSVVYVDSAAYVYDILLGEHLLARARLRENLLNGRTENLGRLGNSVEPCTDVLLNHPRIILRPYLLLPI